MNHPLLKPVSIFLACTMLILVGVRIASSTHTDTPPILVSPAVYDKDFTDVRVFSGAYHNIFVGKVIQVLEPSSRNNFPLSLYRVQVQSSIKGNLTGIVEVAQMGGMKDGTLVVMEGDMESAKRDGASSPLLQTGSNYLLATRGDGSEGYTMLGTNPYAKVLLGTDARLSSAALDDLLMSHPRVLALRTAYPDEIPMKEDVLRDIAHNSFASLSEAKKQEALGKAEEARGRRATPLHAQ
jgi:hypothetical protein